MPIYHVIAKVEADLEADSEDAAKEALRGVVGLLINPQTYELIAVDDIVATETGETDETDGNDTR